MAALRNGPAPESVWVMEVPQNTEQCICIINFNGNGDFGNGKMGCHALTTALSLESHLLQVFGYHVQLTRLHSPYPSPGVCLGVLCRPI